MNLSNWSHSLLAFIAQIFVCFTAYLFHVTVFEGLVMGALFGVGFYFGREVAQHERKAGTPPWWSGFRFQDWSLDAKFDFLVPFGTSILVCLVGWFATR